MPLATILMVISILEEVGKLAAATPAIVEAVQAASGLLAAGDEPTDQHVAYLARLRALTEGKA